MTDKLEELVRRWRDTAMNHSAENPYTAGEQIGLLGCAEDLSALRRDYVLVPREPTQEDVERVSRFIQQFSEYQSYRDRALELWAAIVGGTDET